MGKHVYFFGEGHADGDGTMKDVLGGKGAGLAEMTRAGIPVPPGYTIATAACRLYLQGGGVLPPDLLAAEAAALARLERVAGKPLGDPADPLLVSVRSGAKFSMPGMMDTILNLGLNDQSVLGLAARTQNRRFALDSYRRFIQMFGNVVLGIDKGEFEHALSAVKTARGAKEDVDLAAEDLVEVVKRFKEIIRQQSGADFPQDPRRQLTMARDAVFQSWNNKRARDYRAMHKIPDDLGTAVNVQAMVFGNLGPTSGTGVGFTRNPATGAHEFYGDFLFNAQGEDVVAGIRTPLPIAELEREMPGVANELREITQRLERHYRDVQDFEFTIQDGKLYLLQTRVGKRSGRAAVKIAVDMEKEGLLSREEALLRVTPDDVDQCLHPSIEVPKKEAEKKAQDERVIARGMGASPGAVVGAIVFSADEAVAEVGKGRRVVLVRAETNPDDILGMKAAEGILTATGGKTSHAAVVGRGMGKTCVVGCTDIERIDEEDGVLEIGGKTLRRGDVITIDGTSGRVWPGAEKLVQAEMSGDLETILHWADELRTVGVRANADTPEDAARAIKFGAQGIGLCRTEHMFFGEERIPKMREVVLTAAEAKRHEREIDAFERRLAEARSTGERERLTADLEGTKAEGAGPIGRYRAALAALMPYQKADFKDILREMAGKPVTIRTLDPPMHEFLPPREELLVEIALAEARGEKSAALEERKALLRRVENLHELNPMLGHRGCRLGISYPEITEMQARAIFEAACELKREGTDAIPEVMIPLVGHVEELKRQAEIVRRVAEETINQSGIRVKYLVGTMIEVPRAALTASAIAGAADFFSFGTNDLTQMTFGYSRDDSGKFLPFYIESKVLPGDPFASIDEEGVGRLIQIAVEEGRKARPGIKIGICGEHGGDPASIDFCARQGFDYVSCSPFRVPVARLAAAQAALRSGRTREPVASA
jgi:pyruvate, orthophosphate dikinase